MATATSSKASVLASETATTTGGREGRSVSADGKINFQISPPGSNGPGTNPEQLFAAGWSACFIGAMGRAAKDKRVLLPADTAVDAEVDLGTNEGGFQLQARLNVSLPGLAREVAQELVETAHQICPYSKMSRGNIDVTINLV